MIEQTEDYKTNITKLHDRADTWIQNNKTYKTNITKLHDRADRGL